MNHRLLILGTLSEFVLLVQKAKERGIYTIVCDGYADGPARRFADEDYLIPVTETEEIAQLCRNKQIDGIMTSFSDLLLECMVKIADSAGLPCYLKPEQLPWYRDKSATKELLGELGLPSPKFRCLKVSDLTPENLAAQEKELLDGLSYPLVTKPMDKYGSRGIYVSRNTQELALAAQKTAQFCDSPELLAEEYNDGHEFNMMTWVLDGRVRVISIADREKTTVADCEIPISTRNVYPSRLYRQVAEPATALLQAFVERTGQRDGALSMQFFWSPEKGIQVCEIAARFFGYEHDLTDIAFGFNMEELLLDALYDRDGLRALLDCHDPEHPLRHGAVLYFQGRLLPIADQSAARALADHPAVHSSMIFYEDGESVIAHGPNPYVALYYISAESREELDQISHQFFEEMTVKTPEGDEVLYRNQIPEYPKELPA